MFYYCRQTALIARTELTVSSLRVARILDVGVCCCILIEPMVNRISLSLFKQSRAYTPTL